ncbi:MAG: PfkB family carbohydrate kinase [Xanthobacteraceae bacterium]
MSWRKESSADDAPAHNAGTSAPLVLCAGIIVLDKVFRVEQVPQPDRKVEAKDFFIVSGGCAANAAIAVARLGGRATLAGPLGGPAGEDGNGDLVLAALAREHVDCSACQRIDGLATGLSAIFIDSRGDRTIVTYRDQRIAAVMPTDPDSIVAAADLVLADNRYPQYVRPICEAARHRKLRIVLDADKATVEDDVLFRIASHVVFSAECLRATAGRADLAEGLAVIAQQTDAFLAVSDGPNDILFLDAGALRRLPVFAIRAVDTLGAGDALHAGFALALAEGHSEAEALRFGAAVAGIKCTRIGGSAGAPQRAEVEAFLAERRVGFSV